MASGETEAAPGSARGETRTVEPTRLQQSVARNVAEAKATVPHLYAETEVRMDGWTERLAAGDAPAATDAVTWAAGRALRDHPRVNGAYRDGRFELYSRVNIGLPVASGEGFVVATIHDADRKGIEEIAAERTELERRARVGEITQPELSGGTFTVVAAGGAGADSLTPVVHRGQAAVLGVGDLAPRPVVRGDAVVAAPTVRLTLGADNRILTAADAAVFLGAVSGLLESPPAEI